MFRINLTVNKEEKKKLLATIRVDLNDDGETHGLINFSIILDKITTNSLINLHCV
jgi:hypothetical protein